MAARCRLTVLAARRVVRLAPARRLEIAVASMGGVAPRLITVARVVTLGLERVEARLLLLRRQ